MIRVVFWESWFDSAEISLKKLLKQTPEGDGVWKDMIGISDVKDADYYVIFQKDSIHSRNFPENKKIFIQREPEATIPAKEFEKNRGVFKASYENTYHFVMWWLDKTYAELKEMPCPRKDKPLNAILSYKRRTDGHKLRHDLVRKFLDTWPGDMDVYGSFLLPDDHEDVRHHRYPPLDKYASSIDYHYQFVSENSQENNYFSEKIIDAYLCYNVPIYWGCPNLGDYFPKESFYEVDITKPDAIEEVRDISRTPPSKATMDAVRYARELILDKYNIWPSVYQLIKGLPSVK